jgi:peptidylprolyl isomerase
MAVNALVKTRDEFPTGSSSGPPLVYLDVSIGGGTPSRRLHIELFHDELPTASDNFRMLCTGERKGSGRVKALWLKGTRFHRVIPGFMMQGGDLTHGNGAGGAAAIGGVFDDESFLFRHQLGSVSLAHQGDSNKSQFFIAFRELSWCDGKHAVFGQVLHEDLPHLAALEALGSRSGRPVKPIVITDAGQLAGDGLTAPPSSTAPVASRPRD